MLGKSSKNILPNGGDESHGPESGTKNNQRNKSKKWYPQTPYLEDHPI